MTTALIDVHNPLFLHPADSPGINLISKQLIGTVNYSIWSRAMLIALRAKNKSCRPAVNYELYKSRIYATQSFYRGF